MAPHVLSDDEREALWRRAELRLRLVDVEPPVSKEEIDRILAVVGRRQPGQSVIAWLKAAAQAAPDGMPEATAEIIPFNPRRQRFQAVATFVRLAADNGGMEIPLPAHPLETEDGCFRLQVTQDEDQLVILIQALGRASDEYAGSVMALTAAGREDAPVAVIEMDEDGDGKIRLPDREELRRALLRPVLGRIEDL